MFDNKKNQTIFIVIVLLFLIIPVFIVTITNSSILNDASNWILNALSKFSDGGGEGRWYIENNFDHRARMSVIFLQFLPVNIAYFVFKINSLKYLIHIYSATLIILPIIASLYSVLLFYRVKKANWSVFPLLILFAGIFPVITYGCVEAYIAITLFFILFQYYYLNLKLNKFDYFLLILISLFAYNLHECIVLVYPIILFTYIKRPDKNKLLTFGIINLTISFLLHFIWAFTEIGPEILSDNAVRSSVFAFIIPLFFDHLINFHCLLYLILLINIIICLLSKNYKLPYITSFISGLIILLSYKFWFIYFMVVYRFMCIFITCIIMILLVSCKNDFLDKVSKNIIILFFVCILSSNLYIYKSSKIFKEYQDDLVKASNKPLFYLQDGKDIFKELPFDIYSYHNNIELIAYSIIAINSVKNTNKTNGIIIAEYENFLIPTYCNQYLNVKGGALNIKMKTKFWDLTEFKPYFKKDCNF